MELPTSLDHLFTYSTEEDGKDCLEDVANPKFGNFERLLFLWLSNF